jgi:ABC-type polysaccharide/polyol phosphate export permease
MFDWLLASVVAVGLVASATNLLLAAFKRPPALVGLAAVALVELSLLVQLVATIVALSLGQTSKGSIFEFFGYLLVALLIPATGIFWAISEPNRQSTLILGIVPLVIVVMIYRMNIIWLGM